MNSTIDSLGSKMVSTGSSDSWLINRDNSSIWVSNKLGVQVEGSTITVVNSRIRSRSNKRCSSNKRSGGSISNSLGCKMISTGSSNSWFINRNNSSIRVSNKLCVQVKRTSVTIRSISGISKTSSNRSSGKKRTSSSISCTVSISSTISSRISHTCSKLGSKMLSPGSSNCWLINGCHCSIGMGLQTKESLGSGHSNAGG